MKINTNNDFWSPLLLVILFLSIYIKTQIIDKKRLESNYKFTIAVITYFDGSAEGCPNVNYTFKVNNKLFEQSIGNCGGEYDYINIGDRYYVKYYPKDPMNGDILLDIKVNDTLIAPVDGWNELP